MQNDLVEKDWDYTKQAEFYRYRPNYSKKAIEILVSYICNKKDNIKVADIGAGSGNLSLMLYELNLDITAIEPNDAMRKIGEKRLPNIKWIKANGTNTSLKDNMFDWVTFGSSFNVMDRNLSLLETHRILKSKEMGGGTMSLMWNHRDLKDPIQKIAQEIIKSFVPSYNGGVRREDQRPFLEQNSNIFKDIFYLEYDFLFHQNIENYILAWRSVKNSFWNLQTSEGNLLFDKICEKFIKELPKEFDVKYTTKVWSVTKV